MNTKMLCAVSAIAIFAAGAAMAETAHELIERADGASEHADLLAETADAVALMSCVFDGVFVSAMAA